MSRSSWKPFINYFDKKFIIFSQKSEKLRKACILPQMVGSKINVHNGKKENIKIYITKQMIGFKIGQLCFTKARPKHKKFKKKKK